MKTAERSGVFGRSAVWPLGGSEIKSWTEGLWAVRYDVRACPMIPWPMIPRRIGECGMGADGEVPPFTKLPPSLRFPPSFLFPPCVRGREGDWIVYGLPLSREGLFGERLSIVGRSFSEGCGRSGKAGVRDRVVGLGFPDGGSDRDAVVVLEVAEGNGGGCEVVEGPVRVCEIDDVLCDGVVV